MLSGMFSECLLSICTLKELNNVNAGRLLLTELKGKEMHAPQRNRLDHRLWEQWIWKGKSYQCLQKPERRVQRRQARLFSVLFNGRTKSNTHRRRRFPLNTRKQFLLWGWPSAGVGYPERLRNLYPWRSSKAVWTQSCVTCSGGLFIGRMDQMVLRGPFQTQQFCDSVNSVSNFTPSWNEVS